MNIREYTPADHESLIELVAAFRVALSALQGYQRECDFVAAADELQEYADKGFPIFVAEEKPGHNVGYLVCRVDGDTVWAESLFVSPEFRRRGVAGLLYDAAEELAQRHDEPTLYNWVLPNNHAIIAFLKARGYDVLNMVEIRRREPGEEFKTTLRVGDHEYKY